MSDVIGRVVNFLLSPLYTNIIVPQDYAIFILIYSYVAIAQLFFVCGIDAAFLRFYPDKNEDKNKIWGTTLVASAIIPIFAGSVLWIFREQVGFLVTGSTNHTNLISLTVGFLVFDSLGLIILNKFRGEEKALSYSSFKLINVFLTVVLNIVLVYFMKMGIEGIFLANFIASFIVFLLTIPVLLKNLSFDFSLEKFKEMMTYGLPYLPSSISVVLLDTIDRYFLMYYRSESEVGIYGAVYKYGLLSALFVIAFKRSWKPFVIARYEQPNSGKMFSEIFTFFSLFLASLFLFVLYFVGEIVKIPIPFTNGFLLGKEYWEGSKIIPIVLLGYISFGFYSYLIAGMYITKNSKGLLSITFLSLFVNIIANFLLIPKFGYVGAAWSTFIAYLIQPIVTYPITQKFYPIPYDLKTFAKIISLTALFSLPILVFELNLWQKIGCFLATETFLLYPFLKDRNLKGLFRT
ncbi:oligosaccharide flippase family protein [bacterium]|nr:oligosaccharide flippase family protein [bacterium]